jgi:hypothetical protein
VKPTAAAPQILLFFTNSSLFGLVCSLKNKDKEVNLFTVGCGTKKNLAEAR